MPPFLARFLSNELIFLQGAQDVFPPPTTTVPYPEATQIVVGDNYYKLASHLPAGMPFFLPFMHFPHLNHTSLQVPV